MSDTLPVIILIGRPAAGKSEVIDYLKKLSDEERRAKLHIAPFVEIDDFVWVWETFEDDNIRAKHNRPRLNTTPDLYFTDPFIWNLFIEKMNLVFAKKIVREPNFLNDHTVILEFARGGENAFGEAFAYLSDDILQRASIVYIAVSYAESVRKNRKRARPGLEDSILYHSLTDEKMEHYYKINDWDKLAGGKSEGLIKVKGHCVPFAVFQNEPEKTDDPGKLGLALEDAFRRLWKLKRRTTSAE